MAKDGSTTRNNGGSFSEQLRQLHTSIFDSEGVDAIVDRFILKEETQKLSRGEKYDIKDIAETYVLNQLPVTKEGRRAYIQTSNGDNVIVNGKLVGEVFNKNKGNIRFAYVMKMTMEYKHWMPKLSYVRDEPPKHHKDWKSVKVYETTYKNHRIQLKAKVTDNTYAYNIEVFEI